MKLETIPEVDSEIKKCTLCRLSQSRTNAVPGTGKTSLVEIMLVGEGPGRNEDLAGLPFVGAGGRLLDSVLKQAGLDRSELYITNIVKCRPPENRKPLEDEVKICTSNYLERQISLLKPKVICTLGATALEYFTGESKMGKMHGKVMKTKSGLVIFPTYHPAAVFRNSSLKELLQKDIEKLPLIVKEQKNSQASLDSNL
ncbi:MAG: uracil-DNA glycosylase [Nitrososphaerales archaeon]